MLGASADAGKDTQRDQALDRPNLVLALGQGPARRRIARLENQLERTRQRLQQIGAQWDYLAPFHATLTGKARARAA